MTLTAKIMTTGYGEEVARLYRAMIPETASNGQRLANPMMHDYVCDARAGAAILDFPCGDGSSAISIINVSAKLKKDFRIAIGDADAGMLEAAKAKVTAFSSGHAHIEAHQSKLDGLTAKPDWAKKFDLVLVPNVASELFGDMPEEAYEQHLINSLLGARSILKDNGTVLIDSRDWEKTITQNRIITQRRNEHDSVVYHAEYKWHFSETVEGLHTAETKFWDNQGNEATNLIRFAGRTECQLNDLFKQAGFRVEERSDQTRGLNDEPFITYALKPIATL
jgi:hypothetical protein